MYVRTYIRVRLSRWTSSASPVLLTITSVILRLAKHIDYIHRGTQLEHSMLSAQTFSKYFDTSDEEDYDDYASPTNDINDKSVATSAASRTSSGNASSKSARRAEVDSSRAASRSKRESKDSDQKPKAMDTSVSDLLNQIGSFVDSPNDQDNSDDSSQSDTNLDTEGSSLPANKKQAAMNRTKSVHDVAKASYDQKKAPKSTAVPSHKAKHRTKRARDQHPRKADESDDPDSTEEPACMDKATSKRQKVHTVEPPTEEGRVQSPVKKVSKASHAREAVPDARKTSKRVADDTTKTSTVPESDLPAKQQDIKEEDEVEDNKVLKPSKSQSSRQNRSQSKADAQDTGSQEAKERSKRHKKTEGKSRSKGEHKERGANGRKEGGASKSKGRDRKDNSNRHLSGGGHSTAVAVNGDSKPRQLTSEVQPGKSTPNVTLSSDAANDLGAANVTTPTRLPTVPSNTKPTRRRQHTVATLAVSLQEVIATQKKHQAALEAICRACQSLC